jgi:hypothetical protein
MRRIATTIAVSMALMIPGAALAQSGGSTCQAYGAQTCGISGSSTTADTDTNQTVTESGSTLPFTGLDAALLVVGGLSLVGIGAAVRRVVGRQP